MSFRKQRFRKRHDLHGLKRCEDVFLNSEDSKRTKSEFKDLEVSRVYSEDQV